MHGALDRHPGYQKPLCGMSYDENDTSSMAMRRIRPTKTLSSSHLLPNDSLFPFLSFGLDPTERSLSLFRDNTVLGKRRTGHDMAG
jgi:hypothetical protein